MKILIALLFIFTSQSVLARPFRVIVDPGHGGKDIGANRGHLREADIALKVGKYLAQLLKRDRKFRVNMTRRGDTSLSLKQRAEYANSKKGDLFVSIHVNASNDYRAKGVEFYLQNQLPPDEDVLYLANRENETSDLLRKQKKEEQLSNHADVINILEDLNRQYRMSRSHELARELYSQWSGRKKSQHRAIRQAPFYLVSNVQMPSVLVELGFLSHPKEAKKLQQSAMQKKMAYSIYRGIIKFKELVDKDIIPQ